MLSVTSVFVSRYVTGVTDKGGSRGTHKPKPPITSILFEDGQQKQRHRPYNGKESFNQ